MESLKCTCLNPITIRNKNGVYISVPCGKCNACRSLRSLRWVQRIELESLLHAHTYFCTLTYSNVFLKVIKPSELRYVLTPEEYENLPKFEDEQYVSLLHFYGGIPVAPYRDFQLFMKRLRKLIISDYEEEKIRLRYYCISEFGTLSKRPHFHFILWFENDCLSEQIASYIYKAWSFTNNDKTVIPIGRIDCQSVISSAANYVAGYVNSINNLPAILQTSYFRPVAHASLTPAVGADVVNKEDLFRLLRGEVDYVDCEKVSFGKFGDVPLWYSLENFIFPKCKGFSFKEDLSRKRMYLLSRCAPPEHQRTFKTWYSYLRSEWLALPKPFTRFIEEEFFHDDLPFSETSETRLRSAYYKSRLFIDRAKFFHISPDEYIYYIDLHYRRVEYENLKKQLRYEQKMCENSKSAPYALAFVDPFLVMNKRSLWNDLWLRYLSWFNIVPGETDIMQYTYEKNPLYLSAKQLYDKIARESVKTKNNNEYYLDKPEIRNLYG